MSAALTPEEMVRALIAQGVPADRAALAAGTTATSYASREPLTNVVPGVASVWLPFPVRLTLPWSALCSDNERKRPGLTMRGGKPFPRNVMTARYQAAREKIIPIAKAAMTVGGHQFPPLDRPLAIVARVYAPTQRRVDVANFAKGVHDALSKIVYTDDQWLHDVHWLLAGADMDQPRVELEVRPL